MKKIYLFTLLLLISGFSFGQSPVSISTQVSPPYVPYLSDYASVSSDKLRIQLTFNDFNEPQQQVWLKVSLKGQGVTIQQNPSFVPVPITLEAGVPYHLSGVELAPWLALENLSFTGMSQGQYAQTKSLPEGLYELCVEVFDYRRQDVPLSPPNCVPIFISLYDPPRITNPMNGIDMTQQFPQLLNIQWLPMHLDGLNSGFDTEYEVAVFPIPEGKTANQAVLSETAILRERVTTTTFEYNASHPTLHSGAFYALRVQAIDLTNKTHFKNEGYSEVHTFRFIRPCESAVNPRSEVLSDNTAKLSWSGDVSSKYLVEYRSSMDGSEWFESEVEDTVLVVSDLAAGNEYEYRVKAVCSHSETLFTPMQFFEIPLAEVSKEAVIAECGQVSESIGIENRERIEDLFIGEGITVNQFTITLTSVEDTGDGFRIAGKAFIPFFGKNVAVYSDRVMVNSDRQVYEGTIQAIRSEVDSADLARYKAELTPYVPPLCMIQPLKNGFYPNGIHYLTGELYGPPESIFDKDGNEVLDKDGNKIKFRYNQYNVDEYGFDKDGKYVGVEGKEGEVVLGSDGQPQQLDDNGFDRFGYYQGGESKYNEKGYDREGNRDPNMPLSEEESKQFSNDDIQKALEKRELRKLIRVIKEEIEDEAKFKVRHLTDRFKVLQRNLSNLIKSGKADSILVVGGTDGRFNAEYVHQKMPDPDLIPKDNRGYVNPLVLDMESLHGDLWEVDWELRHEEFGWETRLDKIKDLPKAPILRDEIRPLLLDILQEEGEEKFKLYLSDESKKLKEYIKSHLQSKVVPELPSTDENGTGFIGWDSDLYVSSNPYFIPFAKPEKPEQSLSERIAGFEKRDKFFEGIKVNDPEILALAWHEYIGREPQRRIFSDVKSTLKGATYDLPLGYASEKYVIAIDQLVLSPDDMYFDALMSFELPENGKRITFKAVHIPMTAKGFQEARLELVGDFYKKFGEDALLTLKGTEGKTYVKLDCKGFAGFGVQGVLEFCSDKLVPVDEKGNELKVVNKDGDTLNEDEIEEDGGFQEGVKAHFEVEMPEWGEIMAKVDVSPFKVRSADVVVIVKNAYLDLSDISNPRQIVFPADYQHPALKGSNHKLWQGVYLQEFTLLFPEVVAKDGANGEKVRTSVRVRDALIDKTGFSGLVEYNRPLLKKGEGKMEGNWRYSVSKIHLEVVSNQLKGGGMEGQLQLPITKDDELINYTAAISSDTVGTNYLFSLEVAEELNIPLWRLNVNLTKGSTIKVDYFQKKFYPYAILHGSANVNTSTSERENQKEMLAGLRFENLQIGSLSPRDPAYVKQDESSCSSNSKFKIGSWEFVGGKIGKKMAGFPVSIRGIGVIEHEEAGRPPLVGLKFTFALNLMKKGGGSGFSGETGLTIFGTQENCERWKYDFIRVNHIQLEASASAVSVKGRIDFYKNDTQFGNGFRGQVEAVFGEKGTGIEVSAIAQFGTVRGHRYGYVDAMVGLGKGIPLGAVTLNGFAGGFWFGMKRIGATNDLDSQVAEVAQIVEESNEYSRQENAKNIGQTRSGVKYMPDPTAGLGLKAGVLFSVMDENLVKGNASFEMQFSSSGSLNRVGIYGYAYIIDSEELNKLASLGSRVNRQASIYGAIAMEMDFVKSEFHANAEVYINVGRVLRGRGEGGLAGRMELFFGQDKWYIHVGTPSNRVGVKVSVPLGKRRGEGKDDERRETGIETGLYLMAGHDIPSMPPLPRRVAEYLDEPYEANRNETMLKGGRGFAHGLDIAISSGEQSYLLVYGSADANVGYDLLLKDYGNAHCLGSSDKLGWNGWYAHGRVYAYLRVKLGIKIDLKFKKIKAEILDAGLGSLLEAKLPNPFWMRGKLKGHYRILGGKIKGKFKFKFEMGKECEIVGQEALGGLKIISQITPGSNTDKVSVFTNPQVAFNFAVNENIDIEDDRGRPMKLRIQLDHFRVMNGSEEIQADLEWNDDHDVLLMVPHDVLPGDKKLYIEAKIHFEENRGGSWRAYRENGNIYYETLSHKFSTGPEPDRLVDSNILWEYPIPTQPNFYPQESAKGYVQLIKGRPNLFTPHGYEYVTKFRANDGSHTRESTVTYDINARRVNFTIPTTLNKSTIYHIMLVKEPTSKGQIAVDANVKKDSISLQVSNSDLAAKQEVKKLNNTIEEGATSQILYKKYFRTSAYVSLADKLAYFTNTVPQGLSKKTPRVENGAKSFDATLHILEVRSYQMEESFSELELEGVGKHKPLIQFRILPESNWYRYEIYPVMYGIYPMRTNKNRWAQLARHFDTSPNIPPVNNTVYWRQGRIDSPYVAPMVSPENLTTNRYRSRGGMFGFVWDFGYFVSRDFYELQTKCSNYKTSQEYFTQNASQIDKLLQMDSFPPVKLGRYSIEMIYTLPDGTETHTFPVRVNIQTGTK